ncbi:MAG TPA: Cof-type HAD-IIB family hydrolase [Gaiellaceae bacterium]|nr:Cof-type HAD-IIB family hydrolase [Gaiellaceae bacterium]
MTIRLLLSDVDGTLVRSDKSLSPRTIDAVHALHDAGVHFAVTSGRPPRGMEMLVEPLSLAAPLAGFNGGLVVEPGMDVLEEHTVPDTVVPMALEILERFELSIWMYRGADWLVRDPYGPHVEHESRTVAFEPTVVDAFEETTRVAKLVGVSDDHDAVAAAAATSRQEIGEHVSAWRSQSYYLDITHPQANKGAVAQFLSRRYELAVDEIATIGDMPNDVLMFKQSSLSIAMGNASDDVQKAAHRVTATNDDDGFAHAVEQFILGRS